MGLEYRFNIPKTYCKIWPQGCQFCDLILCDGKKESATIKITQSDFRTCAHGCEESVCLRQHEKYGNCNRYSAKSKRTNADLVRAMTDEELAEFISGKARTFGEEYEGYMSALDWLKQEVSE